MEQQDLVAVTAEIVAAHVANNKVSLGDLAALIQNVDAALAALGQKPPEPAPEPRRALVSVRASVKPDHLVCLECGRMHKTLKRHLASAHGMTPDRYRADHGLPPSYPMAAPDYTEQRRAHAHATGLGRKAPESGNKGNARRPGRGRRPAPGRRGGAASARAR